MNQWQANPRFYACEYISGEVHNEESYLRPNKKDLLPGVGFASPSSSVSAIGVGLAQPLRPSRPLRERKRVAVCEPLIDSSDDEEEYDEPLLVAPPSRRKNQAISYASLQANCRRLKQRHAAVKDELATLQKEHSETADKVQCLSSKLVQYEGAQSRNELIVSEARKNNHELTVIKAQLARVSGNLVAVTGNYEATQHNYQDATQQLSRSLTELKSELDAHMGTKAELADAAAKLIVMRGDIVDASIEIEEARTQLFNTTGELIGANDDIAVLEGLYRQRDFQDAVASQSNEDRTLMQKLNAMTSGDGKWKRLAYQLFNIQILKPHLIKLSVKNIREKTYTATSMARVMDLHHGFNLCGLDAFRLVEPAYLGHERLLWSSSSVKRVFRQIEKEMKQEIYFKIIRDRNAKGLVVDGIKFNVRQLFKYIIHHFGLSDEAKIRKVEIAITVDGAPLDDKTGHITIGFKVCDKDAVDPITKKYIFNDDDDGPNLQSGKFCFPVAMILAKDDKQTYNKYLRDIFEEVDKLRNEGVPECEWLPFDIAEPQDMKSFQLCLGRGGACKGTNYFCHLCQLHSDNVQLPNQLPCTCCSSACYHHAMHDKLHCDEAAPKLEALNRKEEVVHLLSVVRKIKAKRGKNQWEMLYDKCSIHLVADGAAMTIDNPSRLPFVNYQQGILKTLNTLGVGQKYAKADFLDQVEGARQFLSLVCEMKYWTDVARFKRSVADAMIRIENAVPCVLHLHKRVMEKILSLIFTRSLGEQEKTKAVRLVHAEKMSKWLNEKAFGTVDDPGTYSVPMDDKTGELGEVKFNDGYAKDVENVLSELITKFLTKPESKCSKWVLAFDGISEIMTTFRQHADFSEVEINALEARINKWSVDWIKLAGREGMTNYLHMICSGHMIAYLRRWKNLYRFSNQGWEYQNASIRYVYHHRSQHGGSSGKYGGRGSKVKPIGMWFLRKLWWMTKDTSVLNPCSITGQKLV
jgi:hypothetical protein